ncbi:uncharacterized protein LOC143265233 [Megachile rotundata]|uniref:uncharacterized protein LOC143265233 n=1 Tax=Megachile rotundata TaxID=143995 RepID=UPI003FD0DC12
MTPRRCSSTSSFLDWHNASGEQRRPDNSDGGTGKHKPAQKWKPLQAFSAARPFRKLSRTSQTRPTLMRNKEFSVDMPSEKLFSTKKKRRIGDNQSGFRNHGSYVAHGFVEMRRTVKGLRTGG